MKSRSRNFFRFLPRIGSFVTGLIYGMIGVIALLSLMRLRDGGADESSMMAILNDSLIGKISIGVILSGLISFSIWRCFEAIRDPYNYGRTRQAIIKRVAIFVSSLPDLIIAFTAVRVLLGRGNVQVNGQPLEERTLAHTLLESHSTSWLVLVIGLLYIFTSVIQCMYGITKGYKDRISTETLYPSVLQSIYALGLAGYLARGFVLGIIGYFFVKSYALKDATLVVNTDKAFDFIGDHLGHGYFVIVAIGTICYGLFMIALGFSYNTSKE